MLQVRKDSLHGWKRTFVWVSILIVLMAVIWVFFRIKVFAAQQKLHDISNEVTSIQAEINTIESQPWYNKLQLVQDLLKEVRHMPWSKYIPFLINLLTELQQVDDNENDKIELSDFRITLDEIELRWSVSRLLLLYYVSEKNDYIWLIERFRALNFLKDIRIQTYQKGWQGDDFKFALHANVVIDGLE